jgi:GR25 family glycosyltransferase involved in LPS biosynthesis
MNKNIIYMVLIIVLIFILVPSNNSTEHFNNRKIDAVVYINLEKREDRKELLLKEFEKMNINTNDIYRIAAVPKPKNGHKGCCQSHILALELAKLNNWDTVAIFEDDFELNVSPEEYNRLINKAINYPKWDVIVLHGSNQEKRKEIDNEMYYLKHSTQSTAYIIKKEYIDSLLNILKNCNSNMSSDYWGDGKTRWEPYALDQQWNKLIEKDNWIGFTTNIGKQREIASSIMIS